ncbi:MAG: HPP family protein [Candidatus Tectimicrobiota bacterium]
MAGDIKTYRVKDVMSSSVISIEPGDTIVEALVLMAQYRVTSLPVTDSKQRCVGVLSTTDLIHPAQTQEEELHALAHGSEQARQALLDRLLHGRLGQHRVSELMTGAVTAVQRETPLLDATREMLRHRIHHLPVVDEHQRLLGIVSTMDILGAFHQCHA